MINKDRIFFQYNNSGDIVCNIPPLTSQLRTSYRKVTIKHTEPLARYKITDLYNYSFMILDGKIKSGVLEHERLMTAIVRTSPGNAFNLSQLKQVQNIGV